MNGQYRVVVNRCISFSSSSLSSGDIVLIRERRHFFSMNLFVCWRGRGPTSVLGTILYVNSAKKKIFPKSDQKMEIIIIIHPNPNPNT